MPTMASCCIAALLVVRAAGFLVHGSQRSEHGSAAFASFVQKYGRTYKEGSEEYERRLALFSKHVAKADEINARSGLLWKAGVTPLADYSEQELQAAKGWYGSASPTGGHGAQQALRGAVLNQVSADRAPPKEVNAWKKLDNLFIRDQGACGSCWAITASTVLAAHAEIYNSSQASFSTQELVDCVANPQKCGGTGGCKGATVELAMDFAMKSGLVKPEENLYTATDAKCKFPEELSLSQTRNTGADLSAARVHSAAGSDKGLLFGLHAWEKLPENKYEPLLRAVYEKGPVAVSVDASSWQLYEEGIFDSCDKDAVINHAVTLIGYGEEKGKKYWLIQNSWGQDYGEEGRIRLLRKDDEETSTCGIDKQPQDGTGCEGGPKEVKVCGACGILYDNVVPHFAKKH